MPETAARPWDQRPDEPGPAYSAFCRFRDTGPGRTMLAAARAHSGRTGAHAGASGRNKNVPGAWWRWARDYGWAERVTAYDEFLARASDAGKAKALESHAEGLHDLVLRKERAFIEAEYEDAELLRKQGRFKVSMPVRDTELPEPDDQGRRVTYKAADPKVGLVGRGDLVAAQVIAANASARARALLGQPAGIAPGPAMADGPPPLDPEERAARDAEWLQSLEALMNSSTGPAVIRSPSSTSSPSSTTLRVSAAS